MADPPPRLSAGRGPGPSRPRPAEAVAAACRRWGEAQVARWCADLLQGRDVPERTELLHHLGTGATALAEHRSGYWPRIWAARALLYAWEPGAEPAVLAALRDEAWRVRELAAKVVLRRRLGAADDLVPLLDDAVPRVRAAAARATAAVGEVDAVPALRALAADDPDAGVRRRAEQALDLLTARLDRPL